MKTILQTTGFRTLGAVALGLSMAVMGAAPASAQSLEEALSLTYEGNPELRAARAQLRVRDERVPQARSGWLPRVNASLEYGRSSSDRKDKSGSASASGTATGASVEVVQPLYTGGWTTARVEQAKHEVNAERARMFSTEQNVLVEAATVYVNAIRDQSVLELQINNLARLEKHLEATRDRFTVGEVTRTDVAQAEARVAGAQADKAQAEGNLASAKTAFLRVVGVLPTGLTRPAALQGLPTSLEATVAVAVERNFTITAAKHEELSAREQVKAMSSQFLPSINLIGNGSHSRVPSALGGGFRNTSRYIGARVNIPLYQAGLVSAEVREAKEQANRQKILIESMRRRVIDNASRAFEAWNTAVARSKSLRAEEKSARIALEGVEQEATVGARTVLDVLDAEQALLDTQVKLARADRNAFVAARELQSEMGQHIAAALNLPVDRYDHEAHYKQVERKAFGTSVSSDKQ